MATFKTRHGNKEEAGRNEKERERDPVVCSNQTRMRLVTLLLPTFLVALCAGATSQQQQQQSAEDFFKSNSNGDGHTNNWAVLVSASRYWFNYRVCPFSIFFFCIVLTLLIAHGQRIGNVRASLFTSEFMLREAMQVSNSETTGHSRLADHSHVGR